MSKQIADIHEKDFDAKGFSLFSESLHTVNVEVS